MPNITETENSTWFSSLLRQLVAYSSILVAMSYLFGRSYFNGYFKALRIDISFIDLSVYEYLEKGWLFLWRSGLILTMIVVYALFALIIYNLLVPVFNEWIKQHKKAYLISVMLIVIVSLILINMTVLLNLLRNLTSRGWLILIIATLLLISLIILFRKIIKKKLSAWIDLLKSNPQHLEKVDGLFRTSEKVFFQFLLFIVFLFIFYSSSLNANDFGYKEGISYLNTNADVIELTSSITLYQLNSSTNTARPSNDLRFLYFNNGHYFLSRLDSDCKPEEIWVVDEPNVVSVHMVEPSVNLICPARKEFPEVIN